LRWPAIWIIYEPIVRAGETYAFPEPPQVDGARGLWLERPPGVTVVATVDDVSGGPTQHVVGSAKMGPNRPGRGSHVATASFMVHSEHRGGGVGRALGEHVVAWSRRQGYRAIQFNAVVETNTVAVHLWRSLGFTVIGTVPRAFDHPAHGLVGLHVMHLPLR